MATNTFFEGEGGEGVAGGGGEESVPVQEMGGPGVMAGDSPVELAAPPPKEKKTGYVRHISSLTHYYPLCVSTPLKTYARLYKMAYI